MHSFLGDVLHEAHHVINGERQEDYGDPIETWQRTVDIFNAITGHNLTREEGMIFMISAKLAREANKHKRDNLRDGCGYFALVSYSYDMRERGRE